MAELLSALFAALLGVLLDQLVAWQASHSAARKASRLAQLERTLQVQQINAAIDKEIAGETDLHVVLDRL